MKKQHVSMMRKPKVPLLYQRINLFSPISPRCPPWRFHNQQDETLATSRYTSSVAPSLSLFVCMYVYIYIDVVLDTKGFPMISLVSHMLLSLPNT